MRVLLAGATGAIGQPLIRRLVEAGHEVTGTTRSEGRAGQIAAAGAEPLVLDVTNLDALRREVHRVRPEVVINELTALPERLSLRRMRESLRPTTRLRSRVGPVLAQAAADAGVRRLIVQSQAFNYRPEGEWVKSEDAPLRASLDDSDEDDPVRAVITLERATLGTEGVEGVVLRYGYFYGPGTWLAPEGSSARDVRRRRYPIVGKGQGVFSFIHVDDAAAATAAAVERAGPGVYNVVDDEPAAMREWLPTYAEAIGAKPPRRVPVWLARLVAGPAAAGVTEQRGASNAKAKRELGWSPRYPSWRQGFREALG